MQVCHISPHNVSPGLKVIAADTVARGGDLDLGATFYTPMRAPRVANEPIGLLVYNSPAHNDDFMVKYPLVITKAA